MPARRRSSVRSVRTGAAPTAPADPAPDDAAPFRLSAEPAAEVVRAVAPTPGQDELNLAEFPIALVTDRIPAGQKTLRFEDRCFDERKGQLITRRLVVTASDEYGLPTAKDDEVILGLIQLTQTENGFQRRTVEFNRADLVRLLRWPDSGPSYRRLELSLRRWLGVSLYYENAWWDHRQKRWTSLGFHILDDFSLTDGGRAAGPRDDPAWSRFTWNENVFKSFDAGHLKQLDLDFYFGLVHPTAKRMYRFLDKRFHHQGAVELELKELAFDHIGLSRNYEGATQLIRKLTPAVEELEEKGYLEPLKPSERFRRESSRRWMVTFRRPASSAVSVEASAAAEPSADPPTEGGPTAELVARGVTAAVASDIVRAFPADRVKHHLEVHDWLLSRKDPRVLRNPAGFLVQSIRHDYVAPRLFMSEDERARRSAADRRAAEAVRGRREAERRREAEELERVWTRWEEMPPPDRERLWADALAGAVPFLADQFRRHAGRDAVLERRYRRLILEGHLGRPDADA